jgi:hypothetical protein
MINNRKVAQPQLGVSGADWIFEAPVEGGITRMLAVYQDVSGAGEIGSVRSARLYYIDIAQGFDAIYIHAGGSPGAYNALQSRSGLDSFDGVNGGRTQIFYRDENRRKTMGYEHSLLTSDTKIAEFFPTYSKLRLTAKEDFDLGLAFWDGAALAYDKPASKITVKFSRSKSTAFEYSADTGLYLASQYGGAYSDGNNGAVLSFANVIVLNTKIAQIKNDEAGRLDVSLTGSGTGYIASGGGITPIKWSKDKPASPFKFTYADGAPLTLAVGKTYVAIIGSGMEVTAE